MAVIKMMTAVVSHRSGETEDAFIADFVVAMGIERELEEKVQYMKWPF